MHAAAGWIPFLRGLGGYQRGWLPRDLLAGGSVAVVMEGAGLMVIENDCAAVSAVPAVESVAVTVKVKVPALLGVPDSAPEVASERPGGRMLGVVDVTRCEYGAVPPAAVIEAAG